MRMTVLLLLMLTGWLWPCSGQAAGYAVASTAVPVLNVPAMTAVFGGRDGKSLKTDRCGQVRELEFIALPGTVFRITGKVKAGAAQVYRVETDDYPTPENRSLYLDSRLVEVNDKQPEGRRRELPERETIIAALRAAIYTPYVWGGNLRQGVAELEQLYYRGKLSPQEKARLTLAGVDCSGLLYEATGGWTPRNTSALLYWGKGVPVSGKKAAQLADMLEPLDLIVWNGHVLIVLDRETVIESRLECGKAGRGGVITTPLRQRLSEIMQTRKPLDAWPLGGGRKDAFVVRRWWAP